MQNHLNTVADDAAAVRTSFARAHGPVVLVGHSYGGTVITAAGTDERVAALGHRQLNELGVRQPLNAGHVDFP